LIPIEVNAVSKKLNETSRQLVKFKR